MRALGSRVDAFRKLAGCLFLNSQKPCEKNSPLFMLCGSGCECSTRHKNDIHRISMGETSNEGREREWRIIEEKSNENVSRGNSVQNGEREILTGIGVRPFVMCDVVEEPGTY